MTPCSLAQGCVLNYHAKEGISSNLWNIYQTSRCNARVHYCPFSHHSATGSCSEPGKPSLDFPAIFLISILILSPYVLWNLDIYQTSRCNARVQCCPFSHHSATGTYSKPAKSCLDLPNYFLSIHFSIIPLCTIFTQRDTLYVCRWKFCIYFYYPSTLVTC